jgi:hypothetical protein
MCTLAKLWKQPRCPTTDKLIKKVYLHRVEFYLAIKMNEILSFVGKWMELENIILSEVSQVQKAKVACSPSYSDYRSITNATILQKTGQDKGRSHTRMGG